jgi:hypothetical protein
VGRIVSVSSLLISGGSGTLFSVGRFFSHSSSSHHPPSLFCGEMPVHLCEDGPYIENTNSDEFFSLRPENKTQKQQTNNSLSLSLSLSLSVLFCVNFCGEFVLRSFLP